MSVIGPVLSTMNDGNRPDTACATCPKAMWYRTSARFRAFCREMRVITWQDGEKEPIQHCDGREAALSDDSES